MTQNKTIEMQAPITVEQLETAEREHGLIDVVIEAPNGARIGEEGPTVAYILRTNFDDDFAAFVRFVNEPATDDEAPKLTHTCGFDPRNDCPACAYEEQAEQDPTLVEPEPEEDQ